MDHIYLDYAATTPVDDQVIKEMMPYFDQEFGNPSSIHRFGQKAEAVLDQARMKVAEILNAKPDEIIFTSCGSESDNLALRGITHAAQITGKGSHIIISPVEHQCDSNQRQVGRGPRERLGRDPKGLPQQSSENSDEESETRQADQHLGNRRHAGSPCFART